MALVYWRERSLPSNSSDMRIHETFETGVVYRNPLTHIRSRHAYFPSLARLDAGELVCAFSIGEAFEAADLRVQLARSTDHGSTWKLEGPITRDLDERASRGETFSECGRITALDSNHLVMLLHRHDRSGREDQGLSNPNNLGFVPTSFDVTRSDDAGKTWSVPRQIAPPMAGSAFELCCPITVLHDGRWLLPTSTWRGWNGDLPLGLCMAAWVSHDQGKAWPDWWDVMHDADDSVHFWESKIVETPSSRLIATAWAYDNATAADRENVFSISDDSGKTWSPPQSTGLLGQTLTPLALDDDHLLCAYRRIDRPGLWLQHARLDGDRWTNLDSMPLWGSAEVAPTSNAGNMVENFQQLRFGAPNMTHLDDGRVLLAFWCYEDTVSVIRWFRITIE